MSWGKLSLFPHIVYVHSICLGFLFMVLVLWLNTCKIEQSQDDGVLLALLQTEGKNIFCKKLYE